LTASVDQHSDTYVKWTKWTDAVIAWQWQITHQRYHDVCHRSRRARHIRCR